MNRLVGCRATTRCPALSSITKQEEPLRGDKIFMVGNARGAGRAE
jgi:protein tyrosine phosphatase (PTP) superfamily phosphohydrolase (DUF442 family)